MPPAKSKSESFEDVFSGFEELAARLTWKPLYPPNNKSSKNPVNKDEKFDDEEPDEEHQEEGDEAEGQAKNTEDSEYDDSESDDEGEDDGGDDGEGNSEYDVPVEGLFRALDRAFARPLLSATPLTMTMTLSRRRTVTWPEVGRQTVARRMTMR
ncbi:hypothetical protein HYPSUDRAFT_47739 [Hypholoma sublateritium FD-334 SS-4]|uniref:Uncharacterized protein n=1 Tax=Hypholoma sublateritium (strain FD-334 SS-4) TaxID=945553 RepID=A0A0D2KN94_HYPSF|nr:hypothetical protein HYPSUDRAFT_47739 [Hypholoma sublateritium FD-334 SS-4]